MKFKILIITLLFTTTLFSQQRLNILVSVNKVITGSFNLSDSYLILKKDTLNLNYEMGRFNISSVDLDKLKKSDKNEDVYLAFKYHEFCPEQKKYIFKLNLKSDLILQEYLFIKVYDFASFPNTFMSKKGYGFEYISPIENTVLAKKKKHIYNKCVD